MQLLHIDSSILGPQSASRQLTASIVASLKKAHPTASVTYCDLAAHPLGHLTGLEAAAQRGAPPPDEATTRLVALNDKLLEDFLAADVVVIGAPMYNFSLPSQLKAWLDRLAVVGKTFAYTPTGPKGLVTGKRVIIASSRGGFHGEGSPSAFVDHQERYLKVMFGFLGVTDLTFIRAEGLSVSPQVRQSSMESATASIERLTA